MSIGEDDDLFLLAEGLELLAAFRSIKIPTTRQQLLHLVIAVAEAEAERRGTKVGPPSKAVWPGSGVKSETKEK